MACVALGFAFSHSPAARAEDRVWVINSDRSIERYRTVEDSFRNSWKGAVVDIDLERRSLDAAEVQRLFRNAPPRAVYCIGSKAYLLSSPLLPDTTTIVLSSAINWQRLPDRTNRIVIASWPPAGAQINLIRYFFPRIEHVGILCSRKYNELWIGDAVKASEQAGVTVHVRYVEKSSGLAAAAEALLAESDALWLVADPVATGWADNTRLLLEKARAARKPVIAFSSALAELGAALTISPDDATVGRQAAHLLLDGEAGGLDRRVIQRPAGTEITLNLRVVEELGLKLNEKALDSVNHIIR
jgi:ABC-type uncharacterized transport system substrate-binding protein